MSLGTEINNPFDLRAAGIPWKGSIGFVGGFVHFDTIENGLRAGFLDLHTAWKRDGLSTLAKLVPHYAPPDENDTAAYLTGVCRSTGWRENDTLDLDQPANLLAIGKAFLIEEQGSVAYDDETLMTAVNLALGAA